MMEGEGFTLGIMDQRSWREPTTAVRITRTMIGPLQCRVWLVSPCVRTPVFVVPNARKHEQSAPSDSENQYHSQYKPIDVLRVGRAKRGLRAPEQPYRRPRPQREHKNAAQEEAKKRSGSTFHWEIVRPTNEPASIAGAALTDFHLNTMRDAAQVHCSGWLSRRQSKLVAAFPIFRLRADRTVLACRRKAERLVEGYCARVGVVDPQFQMIGPLRVAQEMARLINWRPWP